MSAIGFAKDVIRVQKILHAGQAPIGERLRTLWAFTGGELLDSIRQQLLVRRVTKETDRLRAARKDGPGVAG